MMSPEIILPIPEIIQEIPGDLHRHHFPEFQPNLRVKMVRIPEKIVIIPEQFSTIPEIPEVVFRNSGNRSGIPEKCLKNNSGNSGEW